MKRALYLVLLLFLSGIVQNVHSQNCIETCSAGPTKAPLCSIPTGTSPVKTIRLKFHCPLLDNGTGNFDKNNPDHVFTLRKMVDDINFILSHITTSSVPCSSQTYASDTRIQIVSNGIENYNNSAMWTITGSEPDKRYMYPYMKEQEKEALQTAKSYVMHLYNDRDCYERGSVSNFVFNSSFNMSSRCVGGGNAEANNFGTDPKEVIRINMANLYLEYKQREQNFTAWGANYTKFSPKEGDFNDPGNLFRDYVWEYASNMVHEIGHSLGLTHVCPCSGFMMNGNGCVGPGGSGSYFSPCQLATMHYYLSDGAAYKKYVVEENFPGTDPPTPTNVRLITINENWVTSQTISDHIVIRPGAILYIGNEIFFSAGGYENISKITIEQGGTLVVQSGGRILSSCVGAVLIINKGTFNVQSGGILSYDNRYMYIENTGTVNVAAGAIFRESNYAKLSGGTVTNNAATTPVFSYTADLAYNYAPIVTGVYLTTGKITIDNTTISSQTSLVQFSSSTSVTVNPLSSFTPEVGKPIVFSVGNRVEALSGPCPNFREGNGSAYETFGTVEMPRPEATGKESFAVFKVHPNPATTMVEFPYADNIKVLDGMGKLVYATSYASKVDVSGFQRGVYLIQTSAGTSRFVKE